MKRIIRTLLLALLGVTHMVKPTAAIDVTSTMNDTINTQILFSNLAPDSINLNLDVINNKANFDFTISKSQIVSKAILHLEYMASTSLAPEYSQLKIYLNNELMQVIKITNLGKAQKIDVPLNPLFMKTFNSVKIRFIVAYKASCPTSMSPSIWLNISKKSQLQLSLKQIPIKNYLDIFPEPFINFSHNMPLNLEFIFAQNPSLEEIKASSILASWFATKSSWRGHEFSAIFNKPSQNNAIVLLTNSNKPDFLNQYPNVEQPTIEVIDNPISHNKKLLVVSGKNDQQLLTAVKGIALGNVIFRGNKVTIDKVANIRPRQPYDAPNWINIKNPVSIGELTQFKKQLITSGVDPYPVSVNFKLPPDLYWFKSQQIPALLKYRYSDPAVEENSKLNISLNDIFIRSYILLQKSLNKNILSKVFEASTDTVKRLYIPAPNFFYNNKLSFDFDYGYKIVTGNTKGECLYQSLEKNLAVIDDSTTLDFSDHYHYIAMPNLKAFIQSGFPFSRMADLSETAILLPKNPDSQIVSILLNIMGIISAETGFPALKQSLYTDLTHLKNKDQDILLIGSIPISIYKQKVFNLLLENKFSWMKNNLNSLSGQGSKNKTIKPDGNKTIVESKDSISAIMGAQSPFFKQRSIIALTANNPKGYDALNKILTDKKQFLDIKGTASVIRNNEITNLNIGKKYYVGHLPLWKHIQNYPITLALSALLGTLIMAFLIRRVLILISRRRLSRE